MLLATVLAGFAPSAAHAQELESDATRAELEVALRAYFAAEEDGPELRALLAAVRGRDELLAEILRSKSFVQASDAGLRRGHIDAEHRFREHAAGTGETDENSALLAVPPAAAELAPLVLYVPDATETKSFERELVEEGVQRGRFVLLVPDEARDNLWNPSADEYGRHIGPLRELLLTQRIDPERVWMVGSGRGGHATWSVGLLHADRFAGLCPCNGGPLFEGGYKASGGVFLANAKSLVIATVYNTSFDHGLDGCRHAGREFARLGYRFTALEEEHFRTMGLREACERLGDVRRDSHPRELVKVFNHLDAGRHFWLQALTRVPEEWDPGAKLTLRGKWPSDPQAQLERVWAAVAERCARMEGSIRDNRIKLETHGIGRLRIYFDPERVDFARKVALTIDGKSRPPLTLARSAETLLRHVHRTGDTARLYWAAQDFELTR